MSEWESIFTQPFGEIDNLIKSSLTGEFLEALPSLVTRAREINMLINQTPADAEYIRKTIVLGIYHLSFNMDLEDIEELVRVQPFVFFVTYSKIKGHPQVRLTDRENHYYMALNVLASTTSSARHGSFMVGLGRTRPFIESLDEFDELVSGHLATLQ